MEEKKQLRSAKRSGMIMGAVLFISLLFVPYGSALAGDKMESAKGIVDKARITLGDFMRDQNYTWLHENLDRAKGVLIFPQVIKGGFILGGSGGTGVFLMRDEKTGEWGQPAFYTLGSITFGLQIGGEAAEVVMLAMTQKAVDSLLASSFKLGGDASVAVGPIGGGAKASATVPSVTGDFISFAKSKGLYAGVNLEGSVVAVRDSLNKAYYARDVSPAEILVKRDVSNRYSAELQQSLMCKC